MLQDDRGVGALDDGPQGGGVPLGHYQGFPLVLLPCTSSGGAGVSAAACVRACLLAKWCVACCPPRMHAQGLAWERAALIGGCLPYTTDQHCQPECHGL
jgi:hypothetical protein